MLDSRNCPPKEKNPRRGEGVHTQEQYSRLRSHTYLYAYNINGDGLMLEEEDMWYKFLNYIEKNYVVIIYE